MRCKTDFAHVFTGDVARAVPVRKLAEFIGVWFCAILGRQKLPSTWGAVFVVCLWGNKVWWLFVGEESVKIIQRTKAHRGAGFQGRTAQMR